MKRYLYLDIDSVLALSDAKYIQTDFDNFYEFDLNCINVLNNIIKYFDHFIDVIISSDWKYHHNLSQLTQIFNFYNILNLL